MDMNFCSILIFQHDLQHKLGNCIQCRVANVQLCKKRQKNWYGFLVPNNEIRNHHLLQLGANWKKNKYNFIINFLQYLGSANFFYNNSKNDSNFVAALHMVQKEENQKAVRQTYV